MQQSIVSVDSLRSRPFQGSVAEDADLASGAAVLGNPLHDDLAATRVVVWGTGQCAADFVSHLRPGVEVVGHVDNDSSKWGTSFHGTPVVGPAAIGELPEYDLIVIASSALPAIRHDIGSLALPHAPVEVVGWTGKYDGWRCQDLFERPLMGLLQVGITTRCNLMCKHCPRDTDESVYYDLELSTFRKYLSAFEPSQFYSLLVSDFGEVTMLKQFLSYLRAARELGWQRMEFVTNATNGKRELWDAIFGEDLVRKIVISLEATGQMFEDVRDFPWKRFAANVATIAELNRKYGQRAEIVFNAVCMKSNLREIPALVDFAALNGGHLSLVHLNPSNMFNNPLGDPSNHMDRADRAEVLEVFREVKRRAQVLGVRTQLPEDFPELNDAPPPAPEAVSTPGPDRFRESTTDLLCNQPLRWVEIDDKGNVYPCCQMAKRHAVGNIEANTFEEIWAGPEYRRLIDGLRPGGTPIPVCKDCNMYNGKNF